MKFLKKIPFILWFMFVLGAVGTIFPGYILYQSYQSLNWPHTEGLIDESSITQIQRDDETTGIKRVKYTYVNEIEYIYKIDGQFLRNDSSNSINGAVVEYPNKDDAIQIRDQFPKGQFVKVYYNPDNPSNSVLIPTVLYYLYWFLGVFGLILLIVIGLMFYVSSGNRKPVTHELIEGKIVRRTSILISRDL